MDINSLLSPSQATRGKSLTPASGSSSAHPPLKHIQRTSSGTSLHGSTNSSLARSIQPPSSIPAHVRSPSQQPPHSSPLISPVPSGTASSHLPRLSATPTLDTLADFASTQSHSRPTPPGLASRDSSDSQKSAALFPHLTSAGATSNPRASFDIAMVETPKQMLRADYSNTSLSVESQQRLAVLAAYVQETPSAFESHVEIIKILHQGFVDHIYPTSSPNARRDPHAYDLLTDLRQARENMDKLFAVGEEQWLDWLQDESILAQTVEERVSVVDNCRRAVTEEYGSSRLWATYGQWVLHCYKWALDSSADAQGDGPDAERMVGREVFDMALVLDTLSEGVERTSNDMSGSHEVWNGYMAFRFGDTSQKLSPSDAPTALQLFQTRLQTPHAEWQQTFEAFSSFVSANLPPDEYEDLMASTLQNSATAKRIWSERESFETALQETLKSQDLSSEYQAFSKYIEWERWQGEKPAGRGRGKRTAQEGLFGHSDRVVALYERAERRFPTVLTLWEEHLDFLLDHSRTDLLDLLARATKHCPWSGSLWKQYMLTSELADVPFDETEKIKHRATNTGLLDAAGIEEVLIVHDAWCGYLLRRTKRPDATEEDVDVAEMGIRSSIEAAHSLASKLGIEVGFDPSFRLQRKYVEYLKSQRRLDNAGAQFNDAVADYGRHYKFWLQFYEFELQKSVQMAFIQRPGPERLTTLSSAPFAVGVLKQGLQHPELDYPEPLIEALLNHCEDYEDADELQAAISLVRKSQKAFGARRQHQALQAKEIAIQSQQAEAEVTHRTEEVANGLHIGKRKRDDNADEHETLKRHRADDAPEDSVETNLPAAAEELARDREHASVLVQNLPPDATETKMRQYFSSCGTVKHVKLLQDEGNSAIVEFEDAEAAQFALSRDGRELEGSALTVVLNTGSTLFLTNYPAAADESYLRKLLGSYGEIVNVRFPSLQRNKRRRFCYVEFKRPADAQAATELDGKEIEGLQIIVKISNPEARQVKSDKANDARTVFVGQLPFKATVAEVEKAFSRFGKLEQVRVPQDPRSPSRNRGIAFVTFMEVDHAQAALSMGGTDFGGRKIRVNIASEGGNRSTRGGSIRSKSPPSHTDSKASPAPSSRPLDDAFYEERRERSVVICNVPDTVNESRIKAVAEKVGPVRKVILKTNHQGAIIEFEKVADAGRAMLELDNHEIDPGRHIRVTTEKEMLQQSPEHKTEQFARPPAPKMPTANGPVRRPVQPGVRKGGHLGQRSKALLGSNGQNGAGDAEAAPSAKKTNDDFRNLINKA